MKHMIGLLYLSTAMIGFYWSTYLTLTGIYGVPFSRWYIVIFAGAAILLAGAIMWWVSNRQWTRWLPVVGSALLATYFVPAGIVLVRKGRMDVIRTVIILMVLGCLTAAVKEWRVTKYLRLS